MKHIIFKSLTAITIYIAANIASASLMTLDLLSPSSSPLVNYHNPYKNAFSNNNDGFQIYNRATNSNIATNLLDNSLTITSDNLGIINSTNQDNFFGIVDTVNPNNLAEYASASWQIDISNLNSLLFLIDMAAMGDFENSDQFSWQYNIDGGSFVSIFKSSVEEDNAQNYLLESTNLVTLNDPLSINSQFLNNSFQHFSSPLIGNGKALTIVLNAKLNGTNEVLAFQNIRLNAQTNSLKVYEPSSLILFAIALCLLITRLVR